MRVSGWSEFRTSRRHLRVPPVQVISVGTHCATLPLRCMKVSSATQMSAQCTTHGVLSTNGPAANADANTAARAKNKVIVFMDIDARRTDPRSRCEPAMPRRLFYRRGRGGASFHLSRAEVPSEASSSRTRSHRETAPAATRQRTRTDCIGQKRKFKRGRESLHNWSTEPQHKDERRRTCALLREQPRTAYEEKYCHALTVVIFVSVPVEWWDDADACRRP